MFPKLFKKMLQHKLITGIGLLLIVTGGYFGYQYLTEDKSAVRYVTAAVERGTLIVSISGSGQVSVSDQVDIKPKVSGDVVYVGIKNGQEIKAGALLAQIDSSEAQKAVRDDETALETARLELDKLLAPPDELDILQAENALSTAKRNLEELIHPDDTVLLQAENSLTAARDSLTKLKFSQASSYQNALDAKQKAEDNLVAAYEDAFNAVANAFLDLPTLITGLRDVLYGYEIGESEPSVSDYLWNISALTNSVDYDNQYQLNKFIDSAESNYKTARTKYDENFENYKDTSRYSEKNIIEALLEETLETVRAMAETVKSETNMLDYWVNYRSGRNLRIFTKVTEYQSDIKSYTSKTNSHLSSLLSIQRSLEDRKEAVPGAESDLEELKQNHPLDLAAAERSVQEKEEALSKLKNPEQHEIETLQIAVKEKELVLEELKSGADELDIRAKKNAIQQKEEALLSAQQSLADYDIRPPFDGVVANINVKRGDSVSSGTTLATIITKQKIAEITLNEIDAANVEASQKATITFDALENLTITGEVVEVNILGSVSQGVVTYGVKIAFDTQDDRIKPGMSLSASIITDVKQNTFLAPNSAIKQQGDESYVQIVDGEILRSQPVEIGLSNDTMTEILDGAKDDDRVVTQTITANSNQNQPQQNSGFGLPGMPSGGSQMKGMQRMTR